MLTKFIIDSYQTIIEIIMWLTLAGFVIGGFVLGQNAPLYYYTDINIGPTGSAAIGAVAGFIFWTIMSAMSMGVFLILNDIRKIVKSIERQKST
jgi:hypothetical protein